jgi:hypothetical protein
MFDKSGRPVFDAALSRIKQDSEYRQHPPIGSLSFGSGLGRRGLLDQDQQIASKPAPTKPLKSITYFVFDRSELARDLLIWP